MKKWNKIWKQLYTLAAAGCVMAGLMTGCGAKGTEGAVSQPSEESTVQSAAETEGSEEQKKEIPTDPLQAITYGRYIYTYFAEGHGQYSYYFHFYEEDPVLGAVFYAGFANNGMNFVGTYKVEETPCEYVCAADREALLAGNKQEGTAPYTIIFYDWLGNELDRCGYDGEVIYNDMDNIVGSGSSEVYYLHDTEGEASEYASVYDGEMGVAYLDFVGKEDTSVSLTLSHNMTYVDLVDMIVEGDWSMEIREDGSSVFTLTPFEDGDTGAVLTVSADRMTAEYQADNSSEVIELVNTSTKEAVLVQQYEGVYHIAAHDLDADLYLKLYDDNSVILEADVYGNVQELDKGTYVTGEDGTVTLAMASAGGLKVEGDTVHYIGRNQAGEMDVELVLNPEAAAGATILFSFTGTYCTFDCLEDGTFVFAFPDYGVEETGTWTWKDWTFTLTKSDGSQIVGEVDDTDHSMSFTYTAVVNESLTDTFTCDAQTWGTALTLN